MKTFLRAIFSFSMIYCLLLPFTANTKETEKSVETTTNATAHEIAKIDAKELLVLLQASNEAKVTLKAENIQLQQRIQGLTNTNSASDEHLKGLIIQLNNRIDRLESRSNSYISEAQLEILSTSFYERLRSTDDSVSFWGVITGWVATLITLILATFAVFHFGKIKDIESKAKNILEQSQHETRMAVNEAIRNAEKAATDIAHDWIQEEGAKEIKVFMNDLHKDLDLVKASISNLKNNEKIAIESTNNIRKKEKDLTLQAKITTSNENKDLSEHLDIAPHFLVKNYNKLYTLIQHIYLEQSVSEGIRVIKEALNLNITEDQRKEISVFLLMIYHNEGKNSEAISFYDKYLHSYYADKPISHFNKSTTLITIAHSYYELQQHSAAYLITNQALKDALESQNSIFRIYEFAYIHFETSLTLKADLGETLSYIEQLYNIEQEKTEKDENITEQFKCLLFRVKGHHLGINDIDIYSFINEATNTENYLDRAITATHMLLTMGEWDKCTEICKFMSKSLLSSQKRHAFDSYAHILSNHAYSLYKKGQTSTAYKAAKFIDKKLADGKIKSFTQNGKREISEILAVGNNS
ncbi:hypothetical protein AB4260_02175 [Vibrio lentus]